MGLEKVHTVNNFWDHPICGFADFNGVPHVYQEEWSTPDEDSDDCPEQLGTYQLSPADPEEFAHALESWAIWLRWETAFHRGETTTATHPALPEDRARRDELDKLLEGKIRVDPTNFVRVDARFVKRKDPTWSGLGWSPLSVEWTLIEE